MPRTEQIDDFPDDDFGWQSWVEDQPPAFYGDDTEHEVDDEIVLNTGVGS